MSGQALEHLLDKELIQNEILDNMQDHCNDVMIDRGGQVHGRIDCFHPVNATRAHPLTQRTLITRNQQFIQTHFEPRSNMTVNTRHDLNRAEN